MRPCVKGVKDFLVHSLSTARRGRRVVGWRVLHRSSTALTRGNAPCQQGYPQNPGCPQPYLSTPLSTPCGEAVENSSHAQHWEAGVCALARFRWQLLASRRAWRFQVAGFGQTKTKTNSSSRRANRNETKSCALSETKWQVSSKRPGRTPKLSHFVKPNQMSFRCGRMDNMRIIPSLLLATATGAVLVLLAFFWLELRLAASLFLGVIAIPCMTVLLLDPEDDLA